MSTMTTMSGVDEKSCVDDSLFLCLCLANVISCFMSENENKTRDDVAESYRSLNMLPITRCCSPFMSFS